MSPQRGIENHWEAVPNLDYWPRSCHVAPADIAVGEQFVQALKPFLLHLLDQGLAKAAVGRHSDNLRTPGGELIRCRYDDDARVKACPTPAVHLGTPISHPCRDPLRNPCGDPPGHRTDNPFEMNGQVIDTSMEPGRSNATAGLNGIPHSATIRLVTRRVT